MIETRSILAAGLVAVALTHSPLLAQATTEAPPESAQQAEEKDPTKLEIERLRKEKELLSAEYDLLVQRQKNEMVQLELETQRLHTETQVRQSRQAEQAAALKLELERLATAAQLRQAEHEAALAEVKTQVSHLQADKQLSDARREQELAQLRTEAQRLDAENTLKAERIENAKLQLQELQHESEVTLAELRRSMEVRDQKDKLRDIVVDDLNYTTDPFRDGVLYVSDRRIALNGPIITGTADWVTERIHFYNNESRENPIFIVIDSCPGGSVMQGYRIVKAIEESPAPVHVVVKSFAASMAAVITTLADHSYAYPNAIILHHEMSSGLFGNMTQMSEQLENAREWERRLGEPVAQKMGVSLEEFRRLMYENNSNGDWEEFADGAVKLNWVNDIVDEIREDGIRKRPTSSAPRPWFFVLFGEAQGDDAPGMNAIQHDDKGQPFIHLPPLQPFDHYFLYDPQNFYR